MPSSSASAATTPISSVPASAADGEPVADLFADQDDEDEHEHEHEASHCPRCDAPLVDREAMKGPHAGRLFMACSRFPECRYAAPHLPARR